MSAHGTAVARSVDTSLGQPEARIRRKAEPFAMARKSISALALFVSDLVTISLSLQFAILTRYYLLPRFWLITSPIIFNFRHYIMLGWILLLFPLFYAVEGLYTQRRTMWKEVGFLAKATCLGLVAVLAATALERRSGDISRITILLLGSILLIFMPLSRYVTKWVLGTFGLWRKRLLVLGATDAAQLAVRGLDADPVLGYQVIGLLDDDATKHGLYAGTSCKDPVYVLGPLSEAAGLLQRNEAKDVLIAMPDLAEGKLQALVCQLQGLTETLYVVPNLWGLPMMNLQLDGFLDQQIQMLKVSNNLAKPWNGWLKRGLDLVFSSLLAIIMLPLMGLIALLIRLDSWGPALIWQTRLGYKNKNFACLKFRTMYEDGDKKLAAYLHKNPKIAHEWEKFAKLKSHDPRLTRLGRILRRWSLDEFPQIINVLKGEMSLVGPRPYLPRERDRIGSHLSTIAETRPGMTGFWQVSGKNRLTFEDRVRLEVWYVRNWSPWLDLIILVKTLKAVLREDHSG
jgi:Undecaprenyl-phosphate galactose phosphotransferase WbaP